MRRNLLLGIAALAVFSFSACQKEVEVPVVDDSGLVTVTLTADRACDETRAAAVEGTDGVTYIWTEADKTNFKLFSVTTEDVQQNGETVQKEVLTEIENPVLSISSDNTVLTVTAKVEPGSTLRAMVSSEWTTSDPKSPKPRLPMVQNSLEGNMDPSSDILVADDVTVSENPDGELIFRRPVTVNKMTLKGLNSAEKVEKIVLTSEKYLTGYYNYSKGSMSGQHKELTVNYVSGTVNSTELYPVYFVTMPNAGHTLTLVVETIKDSKRYRYTKTFGPVNFTKGKFSVFTVDLKDLGEEISVVDFSGEWIIGGTHGGHSIAATKFVSGYVYPASEVAVNDDVVTVIGSKEPYKMTFTLITKGDSFGRYLIQDAGGLYLSASGGTQNNNLTGKPEPSGDSYWIVTENADGTFDITADIQYDYSMKSMRVNWNNGAPRVTCYAMNSTLPKVALYPYSKAVVSTVSNPVTFSQPAQAGCSIAVSVDGSPITSGTKVTIGKTVTLTAKVGTGYTFGGWTVTGANVASKTEATTTFVMGDSEVAVSATFRSAAENVYTLDGTITGGTNGYNTESEITQNDIKWGVVGNTTVSPWRIGGKSLTGEERVIYCKKPFDFHVGKIVITHGAASDITVNSMKVVVARNAALTDVVATVTPVFAPNGDVTIIRPDGADWNNCYFKIVYNVTVKGSNNRFLEFKSAKFSAE